MYGNEQISPDPISNIMNRTQSLHRLVIFALLTLLLSACGGGGGNSSEAITANFTASAESGKAPLPVSFDASGSTTPNVAITLYGWDFGDGATESGVITTTHTYSSPGSYTVTLTITDTAGETANSTKTITVAAENVAPSAGFSYSPDPAKAPATISFDAAQSDDPDGTITAYSWSFGDGTNGTGITPSHLYSAQGNYDVSLTVTDSDAQTATTTQTVIVGPPNQAPVADFRASLQPNRMVAFDASSSTDDTGVTEYRWSFGDGNSQTTQQATTSHTYGSDGSFSASLIVVDAEGLQSSAKQLGVTVSQNPARIVIIGDSISHGRPGNPSYRYDFWKKLVDSSKAFDLVGTYSTLDGGNPCSSSDCPDYTVGGITYPFDQDHEAKWGQPADVIYGDLENNLNNYDFDIALIHLGTNDIRIDIESNGDTPSNAKQDIEAIITRLRAKNPNAKIALAKIIPVDTNYESTHSGMNSMIDQLNTDIAAMAGTDGNSEVIVVDQHTGFTAGLYQGDGIHPNSSGEQQLANKWYDAITAAGFF